MKLPSTKRILREDLKDAPEWINKIIDPFNSLAENQYQAFNKNITFTENIACFTKTLEYITPSTYPTMDNVEFMNTLKTKALGVVVWQAYEKTTYIPAVGPVYAPWIENNRSIVIYPITGLAASKTYLIRLLVS